MEVIEGRMWFFLNRKGGKRGGWGLPWLNRFENRYRPFPLLTTRRRRKRGGGRGGGGEEKEDRGKEADRGGRGSGWNETAEKVPGSQEVNSNWGLAGYNS